MIYGCYKWLKQQKWSSALFKVIGNFYCAIQLAIHDFPLVFHCNYFFILHHIQDIVDYFPKVKEVTDCDHAHYLSIWKLILLMANQCTQFEVSNVSRSKNILRGLKIKMGHMIVCRPRVGLARTVNLHTKFEVSMFIQYEDMKVNAKCRKWGSLGG